MNSLGDDAVRRESDQLCLLGPSEKVPFDASPKTKASLFKGRVF
jgi:hypothetical protein